MRSEFFFVIPCSAAWLWKDAENAQFLPSTLHIFFKLMRLCMRKNDLRFQGACVFDNTDLFSFA